MKNSAKEIIKIGLILFLITAISAMLLAIVNKMTAPIIAKNREAKTFASMAVVMPEAKNFKLIEEQYPDNIQKAYLALNESDDKIGICIISTANGYGGAIEVLTGISEGKITGIDILSHSETPGLGAKTANPDFTEQFSGKSGTLTLKDDIDAISGATISSTAVTNAVNNALKYSLEVVK